MGLVTATGAHLPQSPPEAGWVLWRGRRWAGGAQGQHRGALGSGWALPCPGCGFLSLLGSFKGERAAPEQAVPAVKGLGDKSRGKTNPPAAGGVTRAVLGGDGTCWGLCPGPCCVVLHLPAGCVALTSKLKRK